MNEVVAHQSCQRDPWTWVRQTCLRLPELACAHCQSSCASRWSLHPPCSRLEAACVDRPNTDCRSRGGCGGACGGVTLRTAGMGEYGQEGRTSIRVIKKKTMKLYILTGSDRSSSVKLGCCTTLPPRIITIVTRPEREEAPTLPCVLFSCCNPGMQSWDWIHVGS